MGVTGSCVTAMGRSARSRPGSGLLRSGERRSATAARWARRRRSGLLRRSCRNGRGGRGASMLCFRSCTCGAFPRTTFRYAPEFRRQMIELVRAGRTPEELAKEFEPSAQAIRNWVAQADRDEGRRADGLTTAEREELNRLRRENRQLKLEREILSKAAAWFARETDVIPPKGSHS